MLERMFQWIARTTSLTFAVSCRRIAAPARLMSRARLSKSPRHASGEGRFLGFPDIFPVLREKPRVFGAQRSCAVKPCLDRRPDAGAFGHGGCRDLSFRSPDGAERASAERNPGRRCDAGRGLPRISRGRGPRFIRATGWPELRAFSHLGRASAPLPLVGRGRGWGSGDLALPRHNLTTPHPGPPPQGGREKKAPSLRRQGEGPERAAGGDLGGGVARGDGAAEA